MSRVAGSQKMVSVGIPTYNRPEGLERTLRQLCSQSYRNIEIIISDNFSPDSKVEEVARNYADQDSRVKYYKQEENRGSVENFHYVYRAAQGEYFMWAADDDEWDQDYLTEVVSLLENNPEASMAFSNFDARYNDGRVEKSYPDFLPLLKEYSEKPLYQRLSAYLKQEESHGKANVIYALFRKPLIDEINGFSPKVFGTWGGDMLTVFNLLSRSDILISPKLMYHVGLPESSVATNIPSNQSSWERVAEQIKIHGQYFLGYLNVIRDSKNLTLNEKLCLQRTAIYKWIVWIWRDLKQI
jgi:glycosyltransferase involved in cell wall biosynthesis